MIRRLRNRIAAWLMELLSDLLDDMSLAESDPDDDPR